MTLHIPAQAPPAQLGPDVPTVPIFRLTVEQYHQMIESGTLTEDDPVELIEGWLVPKMRRNPPHAVATDLTADKLNEVKPAGWSVRRQDPITTEHSEPEPDGVVVRGAPVTTSGGTPALQTSRWWSRSRIPRWKVTAA